MFNHLEWYCTWSICSEIQWTVKWCWDSLSTVSKSLFLRYWKSWLFMGYGDRAIHQFSFRGDRATASTGDQWHAIVLSYSFVFYSKIFKSSAARHTLSKH